jgi:EAL domain-containing protein (putative c-di-GMP-specific phosphodiesterase class I)
VCPGRLVPLAAAASERLRGGETAVAYHDGRLAAFALRQGEVESGLRDLSQRELFELHYQPIFSIATGEAVGAEALVRWNQPGRGQLTAGQFIEIAERTGRIASLDRWAIGAAAHQAAEWRRLGWDGWVSVNLSGRTLDTDRLTHHVATTIESAEADPRQMLVEVTESAAMRDRARSLNTLRELRDIGVHLAVDDFGVGHASFSYLRDFNPDLVKLDKSFLHEVESDARNHRMMEGLILMAHHLGKPVVAEGCEREEQMRWLQDAGCDLVQGYLTGRPATAEAFGERFVRSPSGSPRLDA